jgi:hypothetical protein
MLVFGSVAFLVTKLCGLGEEGFSYSPLRAICCVIRQGVRLALFCMIFWLPIELIEHYHLSELCWNAVAITNIGQGQRTVHPNVDLFEVVVILSSVDYNDVKKYKLRSTIQKELNDMRNKGNVLKVEHLEHFSFLLNNGSGGRGVDAIMVKCGDDGTIKSYSELISEEHMQLISNITTKKKEPSSQDGSSTQGNGPTTKPEGTTNIINSNNNINSNDVEASSSAEWDQWQKDVEMNNSSIIKTTNTKAI